MENYDTIVIGSGIGGLTTALSLSKSGQKVLVLEKHYLPGGWSHSFSLNGFQFSPGIHYIGNLHPGGYIRRILEGLGLANDLIFLELNPNGYDHICIGDKKFDIPKGLNRYIQKLKERFPSFSPEIDLYFTSINTPKKSPSELQNLLKNGLTLNALLDYCQIKDPFLRAILTIQSGDHGVSPSLVPAALHAEVVKHYFNGGYYPKGGGKSLAKAFIKALQKHDGKIKVRSQVERILVNWQDKPFVQGVCLTNGQVIQAKQVVSNADPHITFTELMDSKLLSEKLQKKLQKTEYTTSVLSLFIATDMDLKNAGFDSGNYWFCLDSQIEKIYELAEHPNPLEWKKFPWIFLTITTLKDPTKRKDRLHTLESFLFVSYHFFEQWKNSISGQRSKEYEEVKEKLTIKMLKCIENIIPGISKRLIFHSLGTPLTNTHYVHSTQGNIYGIKENKTLGSYFYPTLTEIKGLYLCGASTDSHGIAGAMSSGLAAASKILGCSLNDILAETKQNLSVYPCDDLSQWPESIRPQRK